jgi:hypothetical protein
MPLPAIAIAVAVAIVIAIAIYAPEPSVAGWWAAMAWVSLRHCFLHRSCDGYACGGCAKERLNRSIRTSCSRRSCNIPGLVDGATRCNLRGGGTATSLLRFCGFTFASFHPPSCSDLSPSASLLSFFHCHILPGGGLCGKSKACGGGGGLTSQTYCPVYSGPDLMRTATLLSCCTVDTSQIAPLSASQR